MRLVKNLLGIQPPATERAAGDDQVTAVGVGVTTAAENEHAQKAPLDGVEAKRQGDTATTGALGGSAVAGGTQAHTLRFLQAQAGGDVAKASLRQSLQTGRPLPGASADAIAAVVGQPLSLDGLQALYGECLPGAHAVVTCAEVDKDQAEVGWFVSWLDHSGHELGRTGRSIRRHDDGSLELHAHTVWVDEGARGQALSVKATEQDITMLKALSDHERSCCSLRAGHMHDVNKTDRDHEPNQQIGSYAWANFGYDFADAHDKRPFFNYGARVGESEPWESLKLTTLELCKQQFDLFLDDAVKDGQLPDDAKLLQSLKDAAATWEHPWEIASFTIPGLSIKRQIGEREAEMHLGKAFLTSEHAVNWDGVFFVNAPQDAGMDVREQYFERNVTKAKTVVDQVVAGWATTLRDGDRRQAQAAIKAIGRRGGPGHVELLKATGKRRPELRGDIDKALAMLSGTHVADGPTERAGRKNLRPRDYQLNLHACMQLRGDVTDLKLIDQNLNHDDSNRCWAATRVLVERELERNPKLVAKHLVKNERGAWILDQCLSEEELKVVRENAPMFSGGVFKEVDRRRAEAEAERQKELAELDEKIKAMKAELADEPEQLEVEGDDSIQAVELPPGLRQSDADAEPEQVETIEEEEA